MAKGMKLAFPDDPVKKCFDLKSFLEESSEEDLSGTKSQDPSYFWQVMACNQFDLPQNTNGKTDMFYPDAYDAEAVKKECMDQWAVEPQPDWILNYYGGRNPKRDFSTYSNIIFSNGSDDPWRVGGIQEHLWDEEKTGLVYINIKDGAHHYDLRADNPKDTDAVIEARQKEIKWIRKFVSEWKSLEEETSPSFLQ